MIDVRMSVRGRLDPDLVISVVDCASREFGNQRGHGELDVEFHDVGDGVELDVDDLVFEGHEADEHQLCHSSVTSSPLGLELMIFN